MAPGEPPARPVGAGAPGLSGRGSAPVVVAVTGSPSGEHVIRRAAEVTARSGGRLLGVHVTRPDGGTETGDAGLDGQRQVLAEVGGTYHEIIGDDVAAALVDFARVEEAAVLVVGAGPPPRRGPARSLRPVVPAVVRAAGPLDVVVVGTTTGGPGPGPGTGHRRVLPPRPRLPRTRRIGAWVLVLAGIPLLTALLVSLRPHTNQTASALAYLLLITVTAVIGGAWPALTAAVLSSLAVNWFFTPPLHTLVVNSIENVLALVVFLAVAALVSMVVSQATRRGAAAARARAEAEALARVAGDLVGDEDPVAEMVVLMRTTFGLDGVTVLERDAPGAGWAPVAASGPAVAHRPADGTALSLGDAGFLVLQGRPLSAEDRHLLEVFAAQVRSALERRRLRTAAEEAAALARTDQLRRAILRAVSHDLRSPLASIKASVTSLLQGDVAWSAEDRREFLDTIDEESDRLNQLVGNLLDMSRIEADAVTVTNRPVALEEVVGRALASLSGPTAQVEVDVSERIDPVLADAGLLERAVANLVGNALRYSPVDRPVRIEAEAVGARVELRVIDHGPGVPAEERDLLFAPFQRLGDQDSGTGVGLGLAVARGFVEAMGGRLRMGDTPGGGLTATVDLPAVAVGIDPAPAPARHGA